MKEKPPARGGARPGAGRKPIDATGPLERKNVSLDGETVRTLRELGAGDLSVGIRRAAAIIRNLG